MSGSSVNSKGKSLKRDLDNKPNEHLSDSTVAPANGSGYVGNDMVNQTMLANEATFQKQDYKLDQLHKNQKDLMSVQCQREGFNGHSGFVDTPNETSNASQVPSRYSRRVWEVAFSGNDVEQSNRKFMKVEGLEHSLNRVSSRLSNKRLDLQLPAMAYADDSGVDMETLEVNPTKSLLRTDSSVLDRKAKLYLEGSSHVSSSHSNGMLDLQISASADADNSDDDVVILEGDPSKSLPSTCSSILGRKVKLNLEGSSDMPSRHSNNRLDLQLPANADPNDSDDDLIILEENPAKSLPSTCSSVLGTEVKLNIEGSSHMPSGHSNNMLDLRLPASANVDDSDDDVVIIEENPFKSLRSTYSSISGRKVKLNLEGSSHMPLMHINNSSDLQLPASADPNDSDDDVVILDENPAKSLSSTYSSVLGTKVKGNLEGISHMNNSNTGLGRLRGSGVNLLGLQNNLKEKGIGESSGSKFVPNDQEMKYYNSYIHETEVHSSNAKFKLPWENNTTNYTTRSRHVDIQMPFAQNGFSMGSVPTTTLGEYFHQYQSSKIHQEARHQMHSTTSHGCLKDINLNEYPRDIGTINLNEYPQDVATAPEKDENTPMEILWVKKKLLDMDKSQVPPSAIEKDYPCSSNLRIGTNNTLFTKGEANMEIQSQNKKDKTNIMSQIDLNVALPFIDDMEIGVHQSKGNTVPQETGDSSNKTPDVDAPSNEFQEATPEGDTLLWFAEIATSGKYTW